MRTGKSVRFGVSLRTNIRVITITLFMDRIGMKGWQNIGRSDELRIRFGRGFFRGISPLLRLRLDRGTQDRCHGCFATPAAVILIVVSLDNLSDEGMSDDVPAGECHRGNFRVWVPSPVTTILE